MTTLKLPARGQVSGRFSADVATSGCGHPAARGALDTVWIDDFPFYVPAAPTPADTDAG